MTIEDKLIIYLIGLDVVVVVSWLYWTRRVITMLEKTLKEKVDLAKGRISSLEGFLSQGGVWEWRESDCTILKEALTALRKGWKN